MKKLEISILVLFIIFIFYANRNFKILFENINKELTSINLILNKNTENIKYYIEENIYKLDKQLKFQISGQSQKSDDQYRNLSLAIESLKIDSESENLRSVITIVENDNLLQLLLKEGNSYYNKKDFVEAQKIYKKILDIDPNIKKALCYFSASQYYQNPGDSSNYYNIKNNLIPLINKNILTKEVNVTALNVLLGISREEGDTELQIYYKDALLQVGEGE